MRKCRRQLTFLIVIVAVLTVDGLRPACAQTDKPQPGSKNGSKGPKRGTNRGTNKDGKGQREVTPADSAAAPASAAFAGPYYALVIGNNNYKYVNKLQTAVNDAEAVAQVLRDRYGFTTKLLRDATRKEILTALYAYRNSPQKSSLLIYYAGHGIKDPRTERAYWLPVDAVSDNDVNWISASTITEEIKAIPSLHVLIISDSCYSGELTRGIGITFKPSEHEAYIRKMLESPSRTLMSSGRDEPVVDGGADGHSKFAYVLLQSLQLMEGDKFTAADLFQTYIQPWVGGTADQVPQYDIILNSGHKYGDFIFTLKSGAKPATGGKEPYATVANVDQHSRPGSSGSKSSVDASSAADIPSGGGPAVDQDAINEVLRLYQEAYNQRDADALWKIWPGAPKKSRDTIRLAFESASSITMSLKPVSPTIAVDGQSATVKARRFSQATLTGGGPQPARTSDITFVLKKSNGTWTIFDIK